jgi:flavoprotein
MLGLVVGLRDTHIINSNKESGQGRYDVVIIPKDNSQLGIILEFKAVQLSSTVESWETQLATAAQQALQQINQSKYVAELHNHGVENICAMGVAFSSKVVKVIAADSDIY